MDKHHQNIKPTFLFTNWPLLSTSNNVLDRHISRTYSLVKWDTSSILHFLVRFINILYNNASWYYQINMIPTCVDCEYIVFKSDTESVINADLIL